MQVDYIYTGELPNKNANAVNVLSFSEALGGFVTLRLYAQLNCSSGEIARDFDIKPSFKFVPFLKRWKYLAVAYLVCFRKLNDLVYTRDFFCALVIAVFGKEVVWETHTFHQSLAHTVAFRIADRLSNFKLIIPITSVLQDRYQSIFRRTKFLVLPDGAKFPRLCRYHQARPKLTVGYVGSFHDGKGFDTVIALAAKLPEFRFLVAGEVGVEKYQEEIKSYSNIEMRGYVSQKDLPLIFAELDIGLLPNKPVVTLFDDGQEIGKYTSPLKMFEYMSYGVPVIASDLPVLREVLTDENAILVPHDDVSAWKHAIHELESVERRMRLGEVGHREVMAKYSWEARAQVLVSEISSLG